MKFKGKSVIVTGAGRGIGREIAMMFAKEGAKVVINYRSNDEAAQKQLAEFREINPDVELFKASVADIGGVKAMVDFAVEKFGGLDIIINNAGIEDSKLFCRESAEEYVRVIETNLIGTMHCTRAALTEMMRKKRGNIINISSVAGIHANIGQAAYSASKAGVNAFTKAIAKEYARFGIRANSIAPGYIGTEMAMEFEEKMREIIPMKKFGEIADVVNMVSFLASDESKYCTGGVYIVDGGLLS